MPKEYLMRRGDSMARIIVDSDSLAAAADDIEHNCIMLGFTDEESAEDDIGFYIPRIRAGVETLRKIIQDAEPVEVQT